MTKTTKTLIYLGIVLGLQLASKAHAETATVADCASSTPICDSNRSKPSGNGCIGKDRHAKKNWTTAKSYAGGRAALCGSGSRSYSDSEVKFQEVK